MKAREKVVETEPHQVCERDVCHRQYHHDPWHPLDSRIQDEGRDGTLLHSEWLDLLRPACTVNMEAFLLMIYDMIPDAPDRYKKISPLHSN